MVELSVEPLPGDPLEWRPDVMWAWVNQAKPFSVNGQARIGARMPMLAADGARRPVFVRFDRVQLVQTQGYSWANHLADEMLEFSFLPDRIELKVTEDLPDVLLARLVPLAGMARLADIMGGMPTINQLPVSLGDSDWGKQCIAFSSQQEEAWLIPDPYFFLTRAYSDEKDKISSSWISWKLRKAQLYWRGAPSGMQKYTDHAESQRVRLVLRKMESSRPELYDTGFVSLNGVEESVAARIEAMQGLRDPEPQMNILGFRYNLDVDGWSCAWTGLFIKLLAGSPVLKIKSDLGFRQWYYHRLVSWRNFVSVASDLGDLEHYINVLEARPDIANEIGEEGRALANGMTFESEFEAAALQLRAFATSLAN